MARLLIFVFVAFAFAHAQAATCRGRVQYASSGKPAANVLIEARSLSGLNPLFLVPQVPFTVLSTAATRSDGTFTLQLPEHVQRLRLAARGKFAQGGKTRWDCQITPRPNLLNIISIPKDFQPWHPRKQI